MDAPTCRVCGAKHWQREAHRYAPGSVVAAVDMPPKRGGRYVTGQPITPPAAPCPAIPHRTWSDQLAELVSQSMANVANNVCQTTANSVANGANTANTLANGVANKRDRRDYQCELMRKRRASV